MRLKSITLEGFKSFPDRTRLDFGAGVSVVVGPNGSGKSNVTDAVLWAMGEQSPLAVRGQSMQDVIFGGGRGVQPRSAAEVELVLDNSGGEVDVPFSEISIARRLERSGEGSYRLNGARCRLSDVLEVLSDTGLGKESHSVISQGRVDAIVISKPRDRRMLIEEAAGLGKHRKRRRRAQLKLERTAQNLDRALDVEREARTRLRPLKRQAEAAQLHERLELQMLQARLVLAREALRARSGELARAEQDVGRARAERAQIEQRLQALTARRGAAERALSERAARHDELAARAYGARGAAERLELRAEQTIARARELATRIARAEREQRELAEAADGAPSASGQERVLALQAELEELERERERELEQELDALLGAREQAREQADRLAADFARVRSECDAARLSLEDAREQLDSSEQRAQQARREVERISAELSAVREFLGRHARFAGLAAGVSSLGEELKVREGYELALAAALGGRLEAAIVDDIAGAQDLLDRAGPDGGGVLLAGARGEGAAPTGQPPVQGALPLSDLLDGPQPALELARRLLADAWLVERLDGLPGAFAGIAVTRGGRVWFARVGELRQLGEGGIERLLAKRNESDRLTQALQDASVAESSERGSAEVAARSLQDAEAASAAAEKAAREGERRHLEALEQQRRSEWLIEQRRAAPAHGPLAVRRAELEGRLAAERGQLEQRERELAGRAARVHELRAQKQADEALAPRAQKLAALLSALAQLIGERAGAFEHELAGHRVAGEEMSGELASCAAEEVDIQAGLRAAGETVTAAEVAAQRLRDQAEEARLELGEVRERLGEPEQATPEDAVALGAQELEALGERLARLERRREQLGPVNPLAQDEYGEALAHVEELERQRGDLELALRELRALIRETDRQIEETFEETFTAAARNFEELVREVFPGGSGRLTLVADEPAPRPVLGGAALSDEGGAGDEDGDEDEDGDTETLQSGEAELPGVEIELTPAGKSTKRLTLLSGGEKSMTALAFLFAVFLARPCPFYILDEVEAALDDLNLDRFLALLRRYCDRAQFIVVTHQKRTMEAADWLYGVSMGQDGVSKVVSRHLPGDGLGVAEVAEVA